MGITRSAKMVRSLGVLLLALAACSAWNELGAQTELIQVAAQGEQLPGSVDDMDSMIKSAMKSEMDVDVGDINSQKKQDDDMAAEMKMIEAKQAVVEETEALEKKDCEVGAWSPWTECSKKCDGGVQTRKRPTLQFAANGGVECPNVAEKKACNTQSCASMQAAVQAKIRHLTEEEKATETEENNKIKARAMNADSVEGMSAAIQHFVKKDTATQMVHVKLPGAPDPTDEELIQPLLKEAIAKNTVEQGMKEFKAATSKPAPKK